MTLTAAIIDYNRKRFRVYAGKRTVTLRPDAAGHLSEVAVEEVSMPADLEHLARQKLNDRN